MMYLLLSKDNFAAKTRDRFTSVVGVYDDPASALAAAKLAAGKINAEYLAEATEPDEVDMYEKVVALVEGMAWYGPDESGVSRCEDPTVDGEEVFLLVPIEPGMDAVSIGCG